MGGLGKIIIENVPDKILSEVENYIQTIINDEMLFMLQGRGFSESEHKSHEWNLHSQTYPEKSGAYGDHVVWGGAIFKTIDVSIAGLNYTIACESLKEAMKDSL